MDNVNWVSNNKEVLVNVDVLPLYQKLRVKRVHDQLQIKELAEILGMSKTTLSFVERGRRLIPRKCAQAVENYLYSDLYIDGVLYQKAEKEE